MAQKLPITKEISQSNNRSKGAIFFKTNQGYLTLSDGTLWQGRMPLWQNGPYFGEVVFNTGMTGYVESLTDPSYAGQILVFTYPLIGNYGVQIKSGESDKTQVSGVVVSEAAAYWSHANTDFSLIQWLQQQKVPLLAGIDTRALTKHLRTRGTMGGVVSSDPFSKRAIHIQKKFVSITRPVVYNRSKTKTVILVDCGLKANILRSLMQLPVKIKRVPADFDYTNEKCDGVLLSNGPGDPTDYKQTINIIKKAYAKNKPVFGICLGSQLMGLAAGAKTYKLKYGHRGHNQPCLETATQHCFITSQNHGYAIRENSLPHEWSVSFRNLNDGSVEGIEHKSKPFFAVQFHPEACPGPTDTSWLFKKFSEAL